MDIAEEEGMLERSVNWLNQTRKVVTSHKTQTVVHHVSESRFIDVVSDNGR